MYTKYRVALRYRDRVYGGLPLNEDILKSWIESKLIDDKDFIRKVSGEVQASPEDELETALDKNTTGFKRDDEGCYHGDYQIKAHIKHAASLLKIYQKNRGTKDTIKEALFVKPEKIYIGKQPDGVETFCGNVNTPQGKRSILKASEYFEKADITFDFWVLDVRLGGGNKKGLTDGEIKDIFTFGQELGIGSNRGFEKGKYDLLKLIKLDDEGEEKEVLLEKK